MQFELTEEQRMIQSTLEEFCRDHGGSAQVRAASESDRGFDLATWQALGGELGLAGLLIPEVDGGLGLGLVEAVVVFEQLGKVLLPSPLFSTVMSASAVLAAGDGAQRRDTLAGVATGARTLALGVNEVGGADFGVSVGGTLTSTLSGHYQFVIGADTADTLILAALQDDEVVLVVVPASTLAVERHTSLDITRPYCSVTADQVAVTPEQILRKGKHGLAGALNVGCLLLAAELTGVSATALDRCVTYGGEREQFGRKIGSFQAVKHKLADMKIALEAAISATYYAACAIDEDARVGAEMASLAKVQAMETAQRCAADMIQLHGGIGFTWEHDAHLYFKRARSSSTLFGDIAFHQERIAQQIGLDAPLEALS